MSKKKFEVQIQREPDIDWEGVMAENATVHGSGALIFHDGTKHVITYAPNAWLTYWEDGE